MIVMNITIPNPMTKPEAKMAHGTASKDVPIMVFQMEALEIKKSIFRCCIRKKNLSLHGDKTGLGGIGLSILTRYMNLKDLWR